MLIIIEKEVILQKHLIMFLMLLNIQVVNFSFSKQTKHLLDNQYLNNKSKKILIKQLKQVLIEYKVYFKQKINHFLINMLIKSYKTNVLLVSLFLVKIIK